jgi:hypothetical protein
LTLLPLFHFSFIYVTSTSVHSGNERARYVGRMRDKTITKLVIEFEHRRRRLERSRGQINWRLTGSLV